MGRFFFKVAYTCSTETTTPLTTASTVRYAGGCGCFFQQLEDLFRKTNLRDAPDLQNRLWNCDETGFCTAVASRSVLTRRGSKEVHETGGGSGRDYITVLGM